MSSGQTLPKKSSKWVRAAKRVGAVAAAIAFMGLTTSSTRAEDLLYHWGLTPGPQPFVPVSGYVPAPFVVNTAGSVSTAQTQLQAQQATYAGKQAVKIQGLLDASLTSQLFNPSNPYAINYAFLDFEGSQAANLSTQISRIRAVNTTTYIGNYGMFPGSGDPSGISAGPTYAQYLASGVNMANEDLYPGSPGYRVPTAGNQFSPNIRSALFTLPIERASFVSANLPAGHKHIPYVARFNNVGSAPGSPLANNPDGSFTTSNQLLSRGDFSALVSHYRLRGVNGVHLLDPGVIGYTQDQFEADAKSGWTLPGIASILDGPGARTATLGTYANVDGSDKNIESTGVVFSGVYSLTQNKLALLISNLDEAAHNIAFPAKIGGKTVKLAGANLNVSAGSHRLLEFTGAGTQWNLALDTQVFIDNNRSGTGVPEPMAMAGAGIFGLFMLGRRRNR